MLTIILFTATATALGIVANSLRKAPEAYEDEGGFHIVSRAKGSAVLSRRKSREQTQAGSLKGARVHP
ncbi:MAG: hypothetical protein QOI34_1764 [Verrucomicrobiota bacterium]